MLSRRTLSRRIVICLAWFALPAGAQCRNVLVRNSSRQLQRQVEKLAVHAHPGIFGVAIVDVRCGRTFGVHKDRAFPLMSDMKAPIAAAVLARIDQGTIAMSQQVALQTADLVPGAAVPQ